MEEVKAMPIRPENKSRYPKDWKQISRRIRVDRAGNRCECVGECGLHPGKRCEEMHGQPAKWAKGKVILTTAHLDHTPENCSEDNLKAMCNRCHLRYDVDHHRQSSYRAKRQRQADAGQMELIG